MGDLVHGVWCIWRMPAPGEDPLLGTSQVGRGCEQTGAATSRRLLSLPAGVKGKGRS